MILVLEGYQHYIDFFSQGEQNETFEVKRTIYSIIVWDKNGQNRIEK